MCIRDRIDTYYKIIQDELSVRQVEDEVRKLQKQSLKDTEKTTKKHQLTEEYTQLSKHLSGYFQTDVQFRMNEKGKGKIVIPFNNPEELERIIGILDNLNR